MKRLRAWVRRDPNWAMAWLAILALIVGGGGLLVASAGLGRDYFDISAENDRPEDGQDQSGKPVPSLVPSPTPQPSQASAPTTTPKPSEQSTLTPTTNSTSHAVVSPDGSVPKALVGRWSGQGNQYAYDSFVHEVDLVLRADATFQVSFGGGATNDEGNFEADDRAIVFYGATGSYVWQWKASTYAGKRKLTIINEGGGEYVLYKQ